MSRTLPVVAHAVGGLTCQCGLSLADHGVAAYARFSPPGKPQRREFRLIATIKYHLKARLRQRHGGILICW
jgi:hypothetical protein